MIDWRHAVFINKPMGKPLTSFPPCPLFSVLQLRALRTIGLHLEQVLQTAVPEGGRRRWAACVPGISTCSRYKVEADSGLFLFTIGHHACT